MRIMPWSAYYQILMCRATAAIFSLKGRCSPFPYVTDMDTGKVFSA